MIKMGYDKQLKKFFVNFKGDSFYECLAIVKKNNLYFDPSRKLWLGNPQKIYNCLSELEEVDTVEKIEWDRVLVEKDTAGIPETTFKRNLLNEDCLLSSPIKGKNPHENFQIECIQKGISQNRYSYFLGMGAGKEQPFSSRILTPTGWTTMKDVQVGDLISNTNGHASKVIGKFYQGEKDIYEVTFNDGSKARCGLDHLWSVRTPKRKHRGNSQYYTLTLREIIKRKIKDNYGNSKFEIPISKPIQFKKREHVISPYVLGVLLGDGNITQCVSFSSDDEEIIRRVSNSIRHLDMQVKHRSKYTYAIINKKNSGFRNKIKAELVRMKLFGKKSNDKFIPEEYLFDSIENRIKLLQGLMDTDGWVEKTGTSVNYYSCSKLLIEDVKFLVQSLGGTVRQSFKETSYKNSFGEIINSEYGCYILDINLEGIDPFSLSRKKERCKGRIKYFPTRFISKIEKVGREQCACIMTGAYDYRYITDECIVTHNTFITLSVLNHYFVKLKLGKVLIVTPPEGVYNWREELKKFSLFAKTNDDILISTAKHNRDPFSVDRNYSVVIITYRHFLTISDDYYYKKNKKKSSKYRKPVIPFGEWGDYTAIVLDESHNIKNNRARQTKIIHLHKDYFYYRYLLTGTPTPNGFEEIHSQMLFLDKSSVPPYYDWLSGIANLGNRFSMYAINYYKKERIKEWEKHFSKWVTRYTSDELLDLPELFIQDTYAEMTDIQKEIYEELINYVIMVLKKTDGVLIPKKLYNKFPYIAQAYENAELLKGKIDPVESKKLATLVNKFNFRKDHGKMEIVDALLKKYIDEEDLKVTISDFHPKTLDSLAKIYKKYNPIVIHGQNTPKGFDKVEYRNEQLEKFKTDPNVKLLIASSTVLSTAVNIVECSRIVNFSRSFSYTNYAQFIKRFHRIGQNKRVIVHNMIFSDSLDKRLDETLKRKKDLDNSIFQKDSLNQDEWKAVLKGEN